MNSSINNSVKNTTKDTVNLKYENVEPDKLPLDTLLRTVIDIANTDDIIILANALWKKAINY